MVELEYVDVVGVNCAESAVTPIVVGIQSQVAVVVAAVTELHPEIDTPPTMKFTVPAREVVAVIRSTVP